MNEIYPIRALNVPKCAFRKYKTEQPNQYHSFEKLHNLAEEVRVVSPISEALMAMYCQS